MRKAKMVKAWYTAALGALTVFYLLAPTLGEGRPPLEHRLAVEHARHDPQQRGPQARLEEDRELGRRRLGRAEQSRGAIDGVAGDPLDVERLGVARGVARDEETPHHSAG